MNVDEFLEHQGVKGMRWGVRKAQRLENTVARNKTRAAVRTINGKSISDKAPDIMTARKQMPKAELKYAKAKDQYKVDKQTMNKIDAKRPKTIAAAELNRISKQANKLTEKEQLLFDTMQFGRELSSVVFKTERSGTERLVSQYNDRQAVMQKP